MTKTQDEFIADFLNEDEIEPHYHLHMIVQEPHKVSFVMTNQDNNVICYLDTYSGEPITTTYFYQPQALTFQSMLEQKEPMELESYCMITSDETIMQNRILKGMINQLLEFFPDYKFLSLSSIGSDSDITVLVTDSQIQRLVDAINRNFSGNKRPFKTD